MASAQRQKKNSMKKKISRKRTKPEPSPDPYYTESEALALARQKVINAAPAITEAIIKHAKNGHYLHARMLFEFIGLTAALPSTPEAEPLNPFIESLAQALGLKLPDVGPPARAAFARDGVADVSAPAPTPARAVAGAA